MIHNEEHIFQLILEKLSGEITPENLDYLNKVAAEEPSVQRCLDEMENALRAAGPGFMNDVYNEMAWGKVLSLLDVDQSDLMVGELEAGTLELNVLTPVDMPEASEVPEEPVEQVRISKKSAFRGWMAAAGLLVIVATGLFFFLSARQPATNVLQAGTGTAGMIRLLLENGDTISLPENSSEDITANQARLHPVPGQLSFTSTGNTSGWNTLLVPTGKDYRVVLADGSQVHLNAFSRLRFPFAFNGSSREVYLEGEAYFNVAPDALHPFIVHTGTIDTKVLGTAFNVNAYTDSLVVTSLVQGSVSTTRGHDPAVLLKPGMETVYSATHARQVRAFDENVTLGWRKGEYTYYNQSLSSLDAVIRRWYGKTLIFEDTALAHKMLTGVIERDHPVTEFLDGLKKTSRIAYHITAEKIYLSSHN
ncbi:FecR domain-containing protein [Chitinophaga sp.]|uniref:FecR family protein n=1 Tax=Chitinophaga sp. TaxID=1869181 RepID=UPI0031DC02ED